MNFSGTAAFNFTVIVNGKVIAELFNQVYFRRFFTADAVPFLPQTQCRFYRRHSTVFTVRQKKTEYFNSRKKNRDSLYTNPGFSPSEIFILFKFDSRRGFVRDVEQNAVYALDLVCNAF